MALIACRQTVTGLDGEPRPLTIEMEQDRIVAVHDGIDPQAPLVTGHLVPGFVDTHCHGAAGADFTDLDREAVLRAIDHHRRHGSTTLFATTASTDVDALVSQMARLAELVEAGELAGLHVEAPFITAQTEGAQHDGLRQGAAASVVGQLVEASRETVRMVTLDPDRHGALEATRRLSDKGIVIALGHSDADRETTLRALDTGVSVATHLFNATRPIHHRRPGPVPVLLNDPRVAVELICDGVQLHHEIVTMAIAAAGPERVMLVTDAMSGTGLEDGNHMVGSFPVKIVDGQARVPNLDGTPGAVAGSTLSMDKAFAFVLGCGRSIVEASMMASTTPARVHGLGDVGTLEPGKFADLCLLDEQGALKSVMRRGQWLERPGL